MGEERQKVHLVVAGASEFGQYACARVLHRAYAHVTKVTLIVARKDEKLFHKRQPAAAEWSHFSSLYECLEKLRSDGRPIDYVFDDNIQYLVAELLKEEGDYKRLGYVATRGEEHLPYAAILSTCCDRILVEKPVSKCVEDVHPQGLFRELEKRISRWFGKKSADKIVTTCEHFAFRKGFSDAKEKLVDFIKKHWKHGTLEYEFRFFEPASAEDLVDRLSAMQDGSILDVGVTHGLGPLSFILREEFGKDGNFDLHDSITWNHVLVKQAREEAKQDAPLIVPVLAETAAYLKGTCKVDDNHIIELEIKSGKKGGKSYERYFRFICEKCSTIKEKCYFGVSLGLAGYTIRDKEEEGKKELKVENFDGGWWSDKLGETRPVAENAQAAMLEEFIKGHDDRFIPLDQACQIVQLGIEAQALGFYQRCAPYRLEEEIDKWLNERKDQSDDHENLRKVWGVKPEKALDRLKMAIGVENEELSKNPCFRVVTIFGPVGVGNTDISERLQETLNVDLKGKYMVHLIKVPRDKNWCKGKGSSDFSVERVMRELGEKLGIVTDVSTDTASDLCARVQKCKDILEKKSSCILIINGIDRLGSEAYTQLIHVLNELPPSIRIIMVSNKGEQACGWVMRTEELIPGLLGDIKAIAAPHRENLTNILKRVSTSISEEEIEDIEGRLNELAYNNITLYQQLCGYLCYIVLPKINKKNGGLKPKELKSIIEQELAAINLPRTITPYPEAMLERISSICIGSIYSSEHLCLIRSLAEVPDLIPEKFLDSLQPGLSQRMDIKVKGKNINTRDAPLYSLFEHTSQWYRGAEVSDKGTFAIFPYIRRVACNYNEKSIQKVCADVDRRRMILRVPFNYKKPEEASINLSLDLLFNLVEDIPYGFGRLNLENGSLFGKRCKELAEALERTHVGRPDTRLHMFLSKLLKEKTNLGIGMRAYMTALAAWMHLRGAINWEKLIPLRDQMNDAYEIDRKFTPFNEAFEDPFFRFPPEGKPKARETDYTLVRYQVSTMMELEKVWYWLYDVEPTENRCSERLIKRGEELNNYVIRMNSPSSDKEKERLAVWLRVLSLLDAFNNRYEPGNRFEYEIKRLNEAFGLLKELLNSISEAEMPEGEGIFMRLGLNKSVCALLHFHHAKKEENDEKKKEPLKSAAEELEALNKEFETHGFKFEACPFALMALVRLRDSGVDIELEKGKTQDELIELIDLARDLFLLRGRDYFAELAKKMKETLKNAKTGGKNA